MIGLEKSESYMTLTSLDNKQKGGLFVSILEWIILGIIFLIGIAACIFVERLKRQGHRLPGSMCSGCPNIATVDTKPERPKIREHEHPDIML